MPFRSQSLGGVNSPPPPPPPPRSKASHYNIIVIVIMVYVIFCVLGFTMVALCPWFRRLVGRTTNALPVVSGTANKGLKKKELKSLPKLIYGGHDEQGKNLSDCAICLADFVAGEEVRILPLCGHGFHVNCIDTWLGSHSSCPSCRRILAVKRCQKCSSLLSAANSSSSSAATSGALSQQV